MEKLYTINQVAEMLQVHAGSLRRWEREGKIKPIRIGRDRRYTDEMINKLLFPVTP